MNSKILSRIAAIMLSIIMVLSVTSTMSANEADVSEADALLIEFMLEREAIDWDEVYLKLEAARTPNRLLEAEIAVAPASAQFRRVGTSFTFFSAQNRPPMTIPHSEVIGTDLFMGNLHRVSYISMGYDRGTWFFFATYEGFIHNVGTVHREIEDIVEY